MSSVRTLTLVSAINDVLSSAAEEIFVIVESTVTEYERRDERFTRQIEEQRRVLDGLLKPHVRLHRAEISKTSASDYWNSARTQQLSSALSILGKDCNAEPGTSKDSHSSSSSSAQGKFYSEGLTSAERQLAVELPSKPPMDNIPSVPCKQYQQPSHSLCLLPCHVTVKDFVERTPAVAADRGEAGRMMKKKLFDRLRPMLTKKDAKLHTGDCQESQSCDTDKQTSDRATSAAPDDRNSARTRRPSSSSRILGKDSNAESGGSKASRSSSTRGQLYSEKRRHKHQQRPAGRPFETPAGNIPSSPFTLSTSSCKKHWRHVRPKKASSDAAGSSSQLPGVSAEKAASNPFGNGSNEVAKPATLAALAARGWRGMKVSPGRRRVRVRDHTVLHPSLLSLCHVTIRDIMERSMALAKEAGWKRKKLYLPPLKRSRFRPAKTKDDTKLDTSDCQDSSDTAMDTELHPHLLQMFEEDSNDEDFLGFPDSEAQTSAQKDVEPSDRGTPDRNLKPTTMVSDIPETTASHDCNSVRTLQLSPASILAKDTNGEPGGTKDSQSSSTQGELHSEGLTSTKQQLPEESSAEVMIPHPPPALIIDFSILEKDSNAKPGGSKDPQPSSTQGELFSEGLTSTEKQLPVKTPAKAMTPQVSTALIIDVSILGKGSIADPGGRKESQSSSPSTHGEFYSERLRSSEQPLPAESPAKPPVDIPSAPFARTPSDCEEHCRPWPTMKASSDTAGSSSQPPVTKRARGRPRKHPEAAAPVVKARESLQDCMLLKPSLLSVSHVTIPAFMERSMENLARAAVEQKLYAPAVKRPRLAIEDKAKGLEGGVAFDGGSSSKIEYFGFDDLGKSDSDEERTQAKVTMEAAAVLASLSTSMDFVQTSETQDNQTSSNTDFLHLPVCKEVVQQERSTIVVQEEPEALPQSKEEQEEQQAKRPEEALPTLPAWNSDDYNENSWTEPLSSTSSEHMETQDGGASQPTGGGQSLRLRCSESDTDNSEWEETRGGTSTGHKKTQAEATSHSSQSDSEVSDETRETRETRCTVCHKQFRYKHDLMRHKRIHTGEKPFRCTICSTRFNQKAHLLKHMTAIHCHCTVCGKVYDQKRALNTHMRAHKAKVQYSCTVCNKSFTRKFALSGHMTTHTKGKKL